MITWSEKAKEDLYYNMLAFVQFNYGEERAIYVLKGIDETVRNIYPFPTKYPVEPHYNNANVRYALKWKYKIIYKIFGDHIEILHVFHTAQNPSKLGKNEYNI